MKDDLQTVIGWKLDKARVWLNALQTQNGTHYELQTVETAPPAKPPRRENAKKHKAKPQGAETENTKSRERAGDWRVLRCRYLDTASVGQNSAAIVAASTCSSTRAIEIVTAREILRNE